MEQKHTSLVEIFCIFVMSEKNRKARRGKGMEMVVVDVKKIRDKNNKELKKGKETTEGERAADTALRKGKRKEQLREYIG